MDFVLLFFVLYSIGVTVVAIGAGILLDREREQPTIDSVPDGTFDHRGLT